MYTNLEKRAVWVIGALAIIAFWAIVIAVSVVVFD
jgi:hypothetical protein